MVRSWCLGGLLAMLLGAPAMAEPDWGRAGGAIFVGAAPAAPAPAEASQLPESRQPYDAAVSEAAARHRIDPKLLHALVTVESAYRPQAVSTAGAGGLTQLMPGTAKALGVSDRFDVDANLSGGADYLARQLVRFGDLRLALAAYNAGPERVARLGRIPQISETQAYVTGVVECYLVLSAGRAVRSARDCRGAGR
ncbi:MAG: lytic transglycosylase domain-containing protein [Phenylobacterium sp.]|uniref:lytic transglycosylase domain-containing protein n=1 Tax=Phenylobacterium sp. TaxID=1871053 RepID=UPI001A558FC2|nr:lytic transglycosylase domain-containing protein [Phenylobacterium sp.]MBL8770541.1 lytic transglycosylase domain-containing protein [Phenylobacterium sp.]